LEPDAAAAEAAEDLAVRADARHGGRAPARVRPGAAAL
jgi:hypothetical protein